MLLLANTLLVAPTVTAQSPAPWRGEYYNNTNLSGSPALVRMDEAISFNWGDNSPGSGINTSYFSIRWTTFAYLDAKTYTFNVTTDDGARLWVDDELILDEWRDQAKKSFSATKALSAGYHSIRLEYYDGGEQAVIMFNWMPASTSPVIGPWAGPSIDPGTGPETGPGTGPWTEPITGPSIGPGTGPALPQKQTIIVDDTDSGFLWGGTRGSFYSRSLGYGGHIYWTWNSDRKLYNWGKWVPSLPTAGDWEVSVYIASRYFGTTRANYDIYHNGVHDRRTLDQSSHDDQWVSLGTYQFGGGGDEYVLLSDVTGDPHATCYVGYDAVRFDLRGGESPQPQPQPGPRPQPQPRPQRQLWCCAITPVLGFGRVWSTHSAVRNGLGCPTEAEKSIFAMEEPFKGGLKLWRQDAGQMLVLDDNGTWQSHASAMIAAGPGFAPLAQPAAGLMQPHGGPGRARRTDPIVRGNRGWAITGPRPFTATAQQFEGGSMLWSNVRGIFVLYDNGRWARYD
jgi:hypothetical protein